MREQINKSGKSGAIMVGDAPESPCYHGLKLGQVLRAGNVAMAYAIIWGYNENAEL